MEVLGKLLFNIHLGHNPLRQDSFGYTRNDTLKNSGMQSVSKRMAMWLSATILLLSTSLPLVMGEKNSYGADISWPIHHPWTNTSKPLNNERKIAYEHFMDGCRKKNGAAASQCDANEDHRLALSLSQPQSMVNFTSTGFKKVRAHEALRKLLSENWEHNKDSKMDEGWESTDIYTNHWDDPAYLVTLENSLKQEIWNYTKDIIEQWTGMELRPISLYGIRVYREGKSPTLLDCRATGLFF
jgi:hypothetical protein